MLPRNKLRKGILDKRLHIYPGPFHPHFNKGLPQFTEAEPFDINDHLHLTKEKILENRHEYRVFYESDPDNPPEEFKDLPRDIDPTFDMPKVLKEKTHTKSKFNI